MSTVNLKQNGRVATIILNRPEKKNSFNRELIEDLETALRSTEGASVVIFEGQNKFFSAGADLSLMSTLSEEQAKEFSKRGNDLMDFIQDFGAITIAALEGGAYGGGLELALSCDLRIASPQTKIGLTEINLAIFPGWGGIKRIVRIAGHGTARYIALTGRIIDGIEASKLGLVNFVTEKPVEFSEGLAQELSQKSSDSIRRIKQLLAREEYSTELETKLFGEVLQTTNARAALERFLKK